MSGTNDLCTPLVAKTLYDGIQDSKWHLFVGARHMPFAEQTDEYCKVLEEWMEEKEGKWFGTFPFYFTKGIHLVIVCLVQGEYISLVVVHSVLVGIGQAYGECKWLQSVLIDNLGKQRGGLAFHVILVRASFIIVTAWLRWYVNSPTALAVMDWWDVSWRKK